MSDERAQTIATLIARNDRYRAISTRVAFVGGVAAATATWLVVTEELRGREFAEAWLLALAITLVIAVMLLLQHARAVGTKLFSAEMNLAMRAVIPPVALAGAVTAWFYGAGYLGAQEFPLVAAWVACYGLALLATSFFAPRSLRGLGWAFLLTAITLPLIGNIVAAHVLIELPTLVMAFTFGGYHLIYALLTAVTGRRAAVESPRPNE